MFTVMNIDTVFCVEINCCQLHGCVHYIGVEMGLPERACVHVGKLW